MNLWYTEIEQYLKILKNLKNKEHNKITYEKNLNAYISFLSSSKI
jgi:hypothetical protein